MIKEYQFFGEPPIFFDDAKSVEALIKYAFEQFDCYEPCGMEIVTIFQCHHPKSFEGWFTNDVKKCCAEEIVNTKELCFAYHLPNCFYFAEGGWGHHMKSLGNHPHIPNPVDLTLRFEDFKNTIVINGKYSFVDVVNFLKKNEYISEDIRWFEVSAVGTGKKFAVELDDPVAQKPLIGFEEAIDQRYKVSYGNEKLVYYYIFELIDN